MSTKMATFDIILSNFAIDLIGFLMVVWDTGRNSLFFHVKYNLFLSAIRTILKEPIEPVAKFDRIMSNIAIFVSNPE